MPMLARATLAALCATLVAPVALAQVITIKTLPIADGEQFNFFPSANVGMAGVSIAAPDSLLDPFVNPAKGSRLHALRFVGTPSLYSISRDAGGGQTLPVGALLSNGRAFGGALFALQTLDAGRTDLTFPTLSALATSDAAIAPFPVPEQTRTQENRYSFATLGTRLTSGISVAGSVMYADLHRIDGVDQLYAGSQSVAQSGGDLDARFGVVRDWDNGASLEALVLHERLAMRHDVTFAESFYDPNARALNVRPRLERNLDHANTWGMQIGWQRPVGDSGWRVGATVVGNLVTHPKLPNYQLVDVVRPVPWDPGHSAAYNFGIGVSQHQGAATFALDLVYEPILTRTWGEAPSDITTIFGTTIPAGGRTIDNHFKFSNALARLGVAQDLLFAGAREPLRLQAGIAAHAIHYRMTQVDHVGGISRRQEEQWVEWSPTWGASFRFGTVDVRYVGRVTHGTGRPGIASDNRVEVPDMVAASAGDILAAPSGPLTFTAVSVTSHQLSLTVPLP